MYILLRIHEAVYDVSSSRQSIEILTNALTLHTLCEVLIVTDHPVPFSFRSPDVLRRLANCLHTQRAAFL
jgi:hypothetical protein